MMKVIPKTRHAH